MIITFENGKTMEVPSGTSLETLSQMEGVVGTASPAMAALVNGVLTPLSEILMESCSVVFITLEQPAGYRIYQRSITMLFLRAAYEVLGDDTNIEVKYTMNNMLLCEVSANEEFDAHRSEWISRIKEKMFYYTDHPEPIFQILMDIPDAMELAEEKHLKARKRLFGFRRFSFVHMYRFGNYSDYFYGFLLPDSSRLNQFDLVEWEEGISILLPEINYPHVIANPGISPKLLEVFQESKEWSEILSASDIGALNEHIMNGSIRKLIYTSEALHLKHISNIAETISERGDIRMVLVAGPSSSGKTTFSKKLCIQLLAEGLTPHMISTDDYFLDREDTPLDENGKHDYEALSALNLERFQSDLKALFRGEEILLPEFDFVSGKSRDSGRRLKFGEKDILVVEGIHCMNEALTADIPRAMKFKIYISALTQLSVDEHNRIPTTDGRLLRRLVRDYATRGCSAQDTIARWESVRRGEDKNIFPYQEEADVMFNSALPYEMAVLKQFSEPLLFSVPKHTAEYAEARRLIKFLDYFMGISGEEVPTTSILREFIGGSVYEHMD